MPCPDSVTENPPAAQSPFPPHPLLFEPVSVRLLPDGMLPLPLFSDPCGFSHRHWLQSVLRKTGFPRYPYSQHGFLPCWPSERQNIVPELFSPSEAFHLKSRFHPATPSAPDQQQHFSRLRPSCLPSPRRFLHFS